VGLRLEAKNGVQKVGREVRTKEWGLESGTIDKKKEMGVKKKEERLEKIDRD
jgi:hypothetical protein